MKKIPTWQQSQKELHNTMKHSEKEFEKIGKKSKTKALEGKKLTNK